MLVGQIVNLRAGWLPAQLAGCQPAPRHRNACGFACHSPGLGTGVHHDPVRIGNTTVMPGDVVFGDKEGVSFIPPHLVQGIVDEAQITHAHDDYLKQRLGPKAYEEYMKRQAAPAPTQR